ncbi:acyltransferase domain-containing protein [Lentisphaerota bacterium ZTH]|nr:acyltransferase domain-containing protein [Lentisphaerota bacterium]WET05379.1 acyltransferase domain-containing protein [Lentisphaerota bacterium ZTH]
MTKIAVLCSGQGRQEASMFKKLSAYPECTAFIDSVINNQTVSPEVSAWLSAEMPDESLLFNNIFAQELICLYQLAIWQKVKKLLPDVALFAGYSLGEPCAYAVAGAIQPENALSLIRKRAEYMTEASQKSKFSMFGLIGLPLKKVERLVADNNCFVAIYNPDNLVIGGKQSDISALQTACEQAGAERIVQLPITVPSHTPLLLQAAEKFRHNAAATEIRLPRDKILLEGISGRRVFNKKTAVTALSAQICTPLRWDYNLLAIREYGCDIIIELGPGKALSNMARQAIHHGESRSLDEFHDLEDLPNWLQNVSYRL